MNDKQWIASLQAMTPEQLLDALVELQDNTSGIGDPYFRLLFLAIVERARALRGRAKDTPARQLLHG